jgi:hypothetical protein
MIIVLLDHSSNMPDSVTPISAEYEYNEACRAASHLLTTLNELEEVETGGGYVKTYRHHVGK